MTKTKSMIEMLVRRIKEKGGVIYTTDLEVAKVADQMGLSQVTIKDITTNIGKSTYILDDACNNKKVDYYVYIKPEDVIYADQAVLNKLYFI